MDRGGDLCLLRSTSSGRLGLAEPGAESWFLARKPREPAGPETTSTPGRLHRVLDTFWAWAVAAVAGAVWVRSGSGSGRARGRGGCAEGRGWSTARAQGDSGHPGRRGLIPLGDDGRRRALHAMAWGGCAVERGGAGCCRLCEVAARGAAHGTAISRSTLCARTDLSSRPPSSARRRAPRSTPGLPGPLRQQPGPRPGAHSCLKRIVGPCSGVRASCARRRGERVEHAVVTAAHSGLRSWETTRRGEGLVLELQLAALEAGSGPLWSSGRYWRTLCGQGGEVLPAGPGPAPRRPSASFPLSCRTRSCGRPADGAGHRLFAPSPRPARR